MRTGAGKPFADCRLAVQFDNVDLAECGCAALLDKARLAGADGIELERCIFYPDGEKRASELERLADEIRFFEEAGFPVAIWTTSLGYGPMDDPDFLRRFPNFRPLRNFIGGEAAVCSTDEVNREAIAQNVRDFIRAGAKTILFDDALLPDPVADKREYLRLCTQPLAGILLAANGAPTAPSPSLR